MTDRWEMTDRWGDSQRDRDALDRHLTDEPEPLDSDAELERKIAVLQGADEKATQLRRQVAELQDAIQALQIELIAEKARTSTKEGSP